MLGLEVNQSLLQPLTRELKYFVHVLVVHCGLKEPFHLHRFV